MTRRLTEKLLLSPLILAAGCGAGTAETPASRTPDEARPRAIAPADVAAAREALVARYGADHAERIDRGLGQVAALWRPEDGDAEAFSSFALEQFVAEPEPLEATARHLEAALETIDGHTHDIELDVRRYQDLTLEPMRPVDELLATYSPSAHVGEDLFRTKVAFVALLNFPVTTLEERVTEGKTWSRERWALARLTGRFENRPPPSVLQDIDRATAEASRYIDGYNVHMGRLYAEGEPAGFAADQVLISHWGLRDEIRSLYGQPDGLAKQRLIARVMERIVRQEIPAAVVDSDALEWDPVRNVVRAPGETGWREAEREPDRRYGHLQAVFRANAEADPYYPTMPTHVARSFERDREMSEERVRALFEGVLTSEAVARLGALVQARLGRPLEPFDLWYTGLRPAGSVDEEAMSRLTRERYPDAEAFHRDIPRILSGLGFDPETAAFLADHIVVEPSRGPGEAVGAERRDDLAHLRTRIGPEGMDYKGYNIAIHELGHTVEQVFSLNRIDHTLLMGVPNTGFTEAFAFLFQARDLDLLGATEPASDRQALAALDRLWSTYEIAGVGLIDIDVWRWMYDHRDASPAEAREAMLEIARRVWNRYYAPVFGVEDVVLPAIYSHIIAYGLYTPDYAVGMIITSQVEAYVRERNLAVEMERMCRLGRLAPDVWMEQAVGTAVTTDALLGAAEAALDALEG